MLTPLKLLIFQMTMNIFYHLVKANLCFSGQDIFAAVHENSPTGEFVANINIHGKPGAATIRLCLTGKNADWFFLEGQSIRLNSSYTRSLDREVLGSVLMAFLTCYENEIMQTEYRIMVEILNENDNKPKFVERTIQPLFISELTAVNSEAFTVKAKDADGDTILYVLDHMSPDASYFRIDLPNTGKVILDKPLDFEKKPQLEVVIHAVEVNTKEKYNATARMVVNVVDGDDQYPQFLPCTPIPLHQDDSICTSPIYTINITEHNQDVVLDFSPGPIHAEDGDKDIRAPLTYTLVSGGDNGRFVINSETGEITLTRRVEDRLLTPIYTLSIMAAQKNDPKKYTVATALVNVQAENRFPPHFNKTSYKGFVIENPSPATLVSTYGHEVLVVQAIDRDFSDGVNPRVMYSVQSQGSSTTPYHVTQEGVLIAKTHLLNAFDRHILKVIARDQETGESAQTSVDVEVLQKGKSVPRSQFGEERLFSDMDASLAGGIAGVILLLAASALCLLVRLVRRRRDRRDPAEMGSVALGKHPNVVHSRHPEPLIEEFSYNNEAYHNNETDLRSLCGKEGIYTKQDHISLCPTSTNHSSVTDPNRHKTNNDMLPILVMPEPLPDGPSSPVLTHGHSVEKVLDKSASFSEGAYRQERRSSPAEGRGDTSVLTQLGTTPSGYERGRRKACEDAEAAVVDGPSPSPAECKESHEYYGSAVVEKKVEMETDGDHVCEQKTNPRGRFQFKRTKAPRSQR